jgi:hypothetical protein
MNIATFLSEGVVGFVVVLQLCTEGYKPTLSYIQIGAKDDKEFQCSAEENIENMPDYFKKVQFVIRNY